MGLNPPYAHAALCCGNALCLVHRRARIEPVDIGGYVLQIVPADQRLCPVKAQAVQPWRKGDVGNGILAGDPVLAGEKRDEGIGKRDWIGVFPRVDFFRSRVEIRAACTDKPCLKIALVIT